jgi:hypothetical protein
MAGISELKNYSFQTASPHSTFLTTTTSWSVSELFARVNPAPTATTATATPTAGTYKRLISRLCPVVSAQTGLRIPRGAAVITGFGGTQKAQGGRYRRRHRRRRS